MELQKRILNKQKNLKLFLNNKSLRAKDKIMKKNRIIFTQIKFKGKNIAGANLLQMLMNKATIKNNMFMNQKAMMKKEKKKKLEKNKKEKIKMSK